MKTTSAETSFLCKRCGNYASINPKQPSMRTCRACLRDLQQEGYKKKGSNKKRTNKNHHTQPRPCAECKVLFRPAYNKQRFCSRPCSNTHNGRLSQEVRRAKARIAAEAKVISRTHSLNDAIPKTDATSDSAKKRAKVAALVVERLMLGVYANAERVDKEIEMLAEAMDDVWDKVEALEKRPDMSPNVAAVDQAEAEFAYIKDSLRKLLAAVEDMGIKNAAIDARLSRLEKDLGV